MDEVSFAIEEKKLVIPVLYRRCDIPLRLRRVQYIDVQTDYEGGLQRILTKLQAHQQGARDSAAQATRDDGRVGHGSGKGGSSGARKGTS